MKRTLVLLTALAAFLPLQAYAHEDGTLRFNHPLTAESPETDTKLRVDYIWQNAPGHHEDDGKVKTHTARLTGEYAFSKSAGGGGDFRSLCLAQRGKRPRRQPHRQYSRRR